MARFSFRKGSSEEEIPEEVGDETITLESPVRPTGGSRRILILALIGVVLIGGGYLANELFLKEPPRPPTPVRPAVPVPPAKAPAPAPPTKGAAPAPPAPAKPPTKEAAPIPAAPAKPPAAVETKPSPPAKVAVVPPAVPSKAEPSKAPPTEKAPAPSKAEAKPSPPVKVAVVPPAAPGKADPSQAGPPQKTPVAPGVVAKPAETPSGYSLQMGAMVMEENAETLKRKLDETGFPSTIRKGTAFVTKHIVTAGEPAGKREADDLSRKLNVDGFPSELLATGGKYAPQIGAFFNLDEAIDLARDLQKKNYYPKIISRPANTVVFQVRHGTFDSRTAAVKRGEELKTKGFNSMVVRN